MGLAGLAMAGKCFIAVVLLRNDSSGKSKLVSK